MNVWTVQWGIVAYTGTSQVVGAALPAPPLALDSNLSVRGPVLPDWKGNRTQSGNPAKTCGLAAEPVVSSFPERTRWVYYDNPIPLLNDKKITFLYLEYTIWLYLKQTILSIQFSSHYFLVECQGAATWRVMQQPEHVLFPSAPDGHTTHNQVRGVPTVF